MTEVHKLSREEILAAQDIEEREVLVPQWRGTVTIRTFTKRQIETMRTASTGPNPGKIGRPVELDQAEFEARIFVEGVIDPKFELEDYEEIQDHSAVAVGLILKEIIDANGLSEAAVAEAVKSAAPGVVDAIRILPSARTEDDAPGVAEPNVSA